MGANKSKIIRSTAATTKAAKLELESTTRIKEMEITHRDALKREEQMDARVRQNFQNIILKERQIIQKSHKNNEMNRILKSRDESEATDLLTFTERKQKGIIRLSAMDIEQFFIAIKSNPEKTNEIATRFGLDKQKCISLLKYYTSPEYAGQKAIWVDDLIEYRKKETIKEF